VDNDVARQRLQETRGMSEEEANQRLASMIPLEVRAPGADWVYKNNGAMDELRGAVNAELDRVMAIREAGGTVESKFPAWWAEFLERNKERLAKTGVTIEGAKKEG
jgi:hypothetical protein